MTIEKFTSQIKENLELQLGTSVEIYYVDMPIACAYDIAIIINDKTYFYSLLKYVLSVPNLLLKSFQEIMEYIRYDRKRKDIERDSVIRTDLARPIVQELSQHNQTMVD